MQCKENTRVLDILREVNYMIMSLRTLYFLILLWSEKVGFVLACFNQQIENIYDYAREFYVACIHNYRYWRYLAWMYKDYLLTYYICTCKYLAWTFTTSLNYKVTIVWGFFRLSAPLCAGTVAGCCHQREIITLWFSKVAKDHAKCQFLN